MTLKINPSHIQKIRTTLLGVCNSFPEPNIRDWSLRMIGSKIDKLESTDEPEKREILFQDLCNVYSIMKRQSLVYNLYKKGQEAINKPPVEMLDEILTTNDE